VDFKNTILIMTTNAGAEAIKNQTAFGFMKRDEEVTYEKMKEMLRVEIDKYFRPEFLNRVDDVIVFRPLTREDLRRIIDIELSKVRSRLKDVGLSLELSDEAKDFLIDKGYNPDFGARPLRRAVENYVEDPLSEQLLKGEFKGKDTIRVLCKEVGSVKQLSFEATSKSENAPELVGSSSAE
jgi:ATP-dependent Clp protease ATP-binding subunit ClpC